MCRLRCPALEVSDHVEPGHFAHRGEVLICYDWDDTLFPTSCLFDAWGLPSRPEFWTSELLESLTEWQALELEQFGDALVQYLSVAVSVSDHVVIVTNAKPGWVASCVAAFAPRALPLFQRKGGPRVVYACEVYEQHVRRRRPCTHVSEFISTDVSPAEREEQLTAQKRAAISAEAKRFYGRRRGGAPRSWANILGFGDMPYERDALLDIGLCRVGPVDEELRIKVVTVPTCRPVAALTLGLRVERLLLPSLVRHDGDLDIDMRDASWASSGIPALAEKLMELQRGGGGREERRADDGRGCEVPPARRWHGAGQMYLEHSAVIGG